MYESVEDDPSWNLKIAFDAFVEAGDAFDAEVAARLHRHIYSVGDTVAPQASYTAFRGRLPALAPLLAKRGLLEANLPGA